MLFKAFDLRGNPRLTVETSSPVTTEVEKQAFQNRLNRGELGWVDVSYLDSNKPNERMTKGAE